MRVHLRGFDIVVAKEFLDVTQICALLQQMRSETVAQRVKGGWSADTDALETMLENSLQGAGVEFTAAFAGEERTLWVSICAECAQLRDYFGGENSDTIFVAFGLFDVQDAAIQIKITDADVGDFADAQTRTIRDAQNKLVFGIGRMFNECRNFFFTEDNGQTTRTFGVFESDEGGVFVDLGHEKVDGVGGQGNGL